METKKFLKAHLDLFRYTLGILSSLAVLVAGFIVYVLNGATPNFLTFIFNNGVLEFSGLILGLIATILLTFAIESINDYFDVTTDIANRRFDRPLARGDLNRQYVLFFSIVLFFIPLSLITFLVVYYNVTPFLFFFTCFCIFIGIGYNFIKTTGFIGNIWVSIGYVAPLFIGFFLIEPKEEISLYTCFLIILTSFFLAIGREIVKDIQDYEGDRQSNLHSLAVRIGPRKAGVIASFLFVLVFLCGFLVGFFVYKNLIFWLFWFCIMFILGLTIYTIMTEEPAIGGKKTRKYTRWSLWWSLAAFFLGVMFIP